MTLPERSPKGHMDNLEIDLHINAEVRIPEWLRAKMGLPKEKDDDAGDEHEDRDDAPDADMDTEEEAYEKALHRLATAMHDGGICDAYFIRHRHDPRKPDRS